MLLYCKHCKQIIKRSKRDWKRMVNKRGYKSWCDRKDRYVYLSVYDKQPRQYRKRDDANEVAGRRSKLRAVKGALL